jgi:SAM-dependent methyltransferase
MKPRRRQSAQVAPWRADWLTTHRLATALGSAVRHAFAEWARPDGKDLLVLDLGCGERPWRGLFGHARCVGVDLGIDGACPDVVADGAALPFAAGAFDLVFSSQVLEHVPDDQGVLQECARVLRPGGQLVLSVPFYWPLHEEPHDFRRFTNHGLRCLLQQAGFGRVVVQPDSGSLTMATVAVLELLPRQHGTWVLLAPLVLAINLLAVLAQRVSADRRSTLNWVVTAQKGVR